MAIQVSSPRPTPSPRLEDNDIYNKLADLGVQNRRIKELCDGLPDFRTHPEEFKQYHTNYGDWLKYKNKFNFPLEKSNASAALQKTLLQLIDNEDSEFNDKEIEIEVRQLLTTKNAEPRLCDDQGNLPINLAINHLTITKMLTDHGALCNFQDGSPHNSLHHCKTKSGFQYLFDKAPISSSDALKLKNDKGDNPIVTLMKRKPTAWHDEKSKQIEEGQRLDALIYLFQQVKGKLQFYLSKEVFDKYVNINFSQTNRKILSKSFESLREPTSECLTFCSAIRKKDFDKALDLLHSSLPPTKDDITTLLNLKLCWQNEKYIKLLRAVVTKANFTGSGTSPLHVALKFEFYDMLEDLIEANAQNLSEFKDDDGKTALDLALEKKLPFFVYLLLINNFTTLSSYKKMTSDQTEEICYRFVRIFQKKNKQEKLVLIGDYIGTQLKNKNLSITDREEITKILISVIETLETEDKNLPKEKSNISKLHDHFVKNKSVQALEVYYKNTSTPSPSLKRRVSSSNFTRDRDLLLTLRSSLYESDQDQIKQTTDKLVKFKLRSDIYANRTESFENLISSIPKTALPKHLHSLTTSGNEEKLEYILKNSCCENFNINQLNDAGFSLLHSAIDNDNAKCVQLLIEHKASMDTRAKNGFTAKEWAYINNKEKCVEYFNSLGQEVYPGEITPPNFLVLIEQELTSLIKESLNWCSTEKIKLEINKTDEYQNTTFHKFAEKGWTSLMKDFWFQNAPIHSTNSEGQTPLEVAIIHSNDETALFLIDKEPDVKAFNNRGQEILDLARQYCNKAVQDAIINKRWIYKRALIIE